ncbi:MAG: two-component sensor histidine kinase, partial [Gelidibacter sp.]|nr:two-component sensor histidine kinase [Gelidibacter sp.]
LELRYKYAKKAVDISEKMKVDSVILRSNRVLSTVYLFQGKLDDFSKINYKNLKLSRSLKDTLSIGIANHNLGYYHFDKNQNDSAYYYYSTAIKFYDKVEEIPRQAGALSNLSLIQLNEKDYFGSEESAIRALKFLESLPTTERNLDDSWILYNRLGNISLNLGLYDKSLEYHKKAIEISNKMNNGFYNKNLSIHNQAFVFRKKGNYTKALDFYTNLLKQEKLFEIDPTFYPLILDNIAFTRFESGEKDYDNMEKMFKEAYKISDSLEDPITKLAVTIDLSKFYKAQNKIDHALQYANESYRLAKETSSNDILLESMVILSELKPGDEGKKYLNEHIRLSDSLLQHERGIRNKFARVQFETDQIQQENERIAQQRFWLLIVSIVLIVAIFLLYIIITQRAKNKELEFKQDQQKANEEIYNLMLSQQDKVDEARAMEKKRISEEIHDGILGRLFGTRLSLDSFNLKEGPEGAKIRLQYINDLKNIEQDIRQISHDLNTDFVAGSGFVDIIKTLIETQTQAYQLKYEFDCSDDIIWENVSNKTKIHIYRILQESMQNIYKHAEATLVKISFQLKNDVICLTIADDGKGFVINKSKKGIGLKNINSRVDEVNGTIEFDSEIDKGTTITLNIPYIN